MNLNIVGWLLDAGTEHERTLASAAWVPSRGGTTNEPMVLRVDAEIEIYRLRTALATAEAALADIGDADRAPGDDMAWCERRAARALPEVRAALMPYVEFDPMATVASHALRGPDGEVVKTALTPKVVLIGARETGGGAR